MSLIYLYGFAPGGTAPPEQGLLGVDDNAVEHREVAGITAVISHVAGDDFTEAREGDADIERTAELGLRHEQVVAWYVDNASILPARLLTLFSSEDALREMVSEDADRIRSEMERLDGLLEWDLRVSYDPERLARHLGEVSEEVAALDREIEEATRGKRFLLEKKRRDLARGEARAAASRMGRSLLETLRPLARDTVTLEPPAGERAPTLNAALLVERAREPELTETVEAERGRLEPLGLDIRLTGPWAPYRFLDSAGA